MQNNDHGFNAQGNGEPAAGGHHPTPIEELLLAFAMEPYNSAEYRKAFSEFHNRFTQPLFNYCKRQCLSFHLPGDYATNAVHDTLLKAAEKAGSMLKIEKAKTEVEKERIMTTWLRTTANRLLLQLSNDKENSGEGTVLFDDRLWAFSDNGQDEVPGANTDNPLMERLIREWENRDHSAAPENMSAQMKALEEALLQLSERERLVLNTYYLYLDGNKNLPSEELKLLCQMLNVLPGSIGTIKRRAFKQLQKDAVSIYEQHSRGNPASGG